MTIAPDIDPLNYFEGENLPSPSMPDRSASDGQAFLITSRMERLDDGLTFVSYQDGDPAFAELSDRIATLRQKRFKEEGLLLSTASDKDTIRGENVEILVILDEGSNPVASLRKVHTGPGRSVETLPSYRKAAKEKNGLSEAGLALLHERIEGKHVAEVGALWKEPSYDSSVKDALYREAFRDAVARNEVWFMGVVTREYKNLRNVFGGLVHDLGDPFPVRRADTPESVRLHPVLIDPTTFVPDMVGEIRAARVKNDLAQMFGREATLWSFLDAIRDRKLATLALSSLSEVKK